MLHALGMITKDRNKIQFVKDTCDVIENGGLSPKEKVERNTVKSQKELSELKKELDKERSAKEIKRD